jgi:hypothetical protein
VENPAGLHAPLKQVAARRLDIGHDQEQELRRAGG